MELEKIRIAIVGVGNCASSLVQGLEYYRDKSPENAIGLMHWEIGGYRPFDIEVVAAFDIDERKVGKDVNEAIFELPNCTTVFCEKLPKTKVRVQMGRTLDGVAEHMQQHPESSYASYRIATPENIKARSKAAPSAAHCPTCHLQHPPHIILANEFTPGR